MGFVNVSIIVGNHTLVVQINWPPNGAVFDWSKALSFAGQAFDIEDGSTINGTIPFNSLGWDLNIGHNDHSHGISHTNTCAGIIEAPAPHGGDGDNVFLVVRASYADQGALSAGSLTGEAVDILQPRRKEAENFTHQSGVSNAITGDVSGGHDLVSIDHGDFVGFYPFNFTNITGVSFRVAATTGGGQIEMHLDSPGGPLLGIASVPNSAGSYTNVTVPITDPAGTHELYLVFTRNEAAKDLFKLNWMEFQGDGVSLNQTPYGGTHFIPGILQAEDFDIGGEGLAYHDTDTVNSGNQYRNGGVDIENCSDTGGGYNVGWVSSGEWLEYTLNVATSGLYKFEARYAAFGGGTFHLEVDGANKSGLINIPNTGGWTSWQTLSVSNIALNAGQQILRVAFDNTGGGGYVANFNYFQFTLQASNKPPVVAITNPLPGATFSAPANIAIQAQGTDADGAVSKVEFFGDGNLLGTDSTSPFSVTWSNVPVGIYELKARTTDNVGLSAWSAPFTVSVINGQAPFYGSPQTIPGTIQAEDFDGGGEGLAYHDGDTPNNGGQYRNTNVDIENTGDTGGGYNVGWTAAGEWLKYSLNATVDGIYSIGMRVASSGNAGTFHLEIDGQNVTGPVVVNDTGGWQIYQTLMQTNVNISAGRHELRWVVDSSGANGTAGNHNYFVFTVAATNAPTVFLQSTANLSSGFTDEANAIVNGANKTISVPQTGSVRFYRLRSTVPTRLLQTQIVGTNVVLTFQ